jgi:hypothetical protein
MPSVEGVENAVTDTLNDEAACMRRRIASSESMIAARKGTIRALRKLREDKALLRQERVVLARKVSIA